MVAFAIERALQNQGWALSRPGLVRGGRLLRARRDDARLDVYYQSTPAELERNSSYKRVQELHGLLPTAPLRPDFVFHMVRPSGERWLLVEVKGVARAVARSARAATFDLLAYRRAFDSTLNVTELPYGLGVAWGAALAPESGGEIMLCTPDTLPEALETLLNDPSDP
jgi:hypothetical protein